jgi:lipoprotein-releasing system ATP-binding protein
MTTTATGVRVELAGVGKTYVKGGVALEVLRGVDLAIEPGERVSIVGPSGCGKSTFLHLVGLLDRPSSGVVSLDGKDVTRMSATERDRTRNLRVGFIFQAHHLLGEHSALANVMVPLRLAGVAVPDARKRAERFLSVVGLGQRLSHKPGELSGGEQQRVAIARALVMSPGLVLADEPTGNLDPTTAGAVFDLMVGISQDLGSTLVVVTHSPELARRFARRLRVADGHFAEAS